VQVGLSGGHPQAGRDQAIQYGIAVLTVALVTAPLLPVLYQSVIDRALYDAGHNFTLSNFSRLFKTEGFGEMVWNTLLFAALTTLIAQLIGTFAAILFGRTDLPGAKVLGELFLWPIYLSALVLSFGWYTVYGPSGFITMVWRDLLQGPVWDLYTIPGMAVIAGVSQAPVAFLYCMASASMADPSLEEAARVSGAGTFQTLRKITVPLLMPAIAYSAVLNFTVALELLAIPLVFGEPAGIMVLTTFLYSQGVAGIKPDHGLTATAAALFLVIICFLVWLQTRLLGNTRRFVTLSGKATRPRLFQLGKWRWILFISTVSYIFISVIAPIGVLLLRAFSSMLSPMVPLIEVLTLSNFEALFSEPIYSRSVWNSLLVSTVAGLLGTLLIALIALVVHRSEFRFRDLLHYVALFPRAVPGVVAGIGFFYAVAALPDLGGIRNTIWILVIAFTMRYIPAGFGAVAPMLMQVSQDLDKAARVTGADWWTACSRILSPLMRPALVACFTLLFISCFKEYATAIFIFAPGSEVIGTSLLHLWIQGEAGLVAALAAIQIIVVGVCVTVARAIFGVKLYG
jgi:iron(III) transport system permease protein